MTFWNKRHFVENKTEIMQHVLKAQWLSSFPKHIIWNSRFLFNLRSRDANAGRLKVNQYSNRRIQIMKWITVISNLAVEGKAFLPGILEVSGLNLHPNTHYPYRLTYLQAHAIIFIKNVKLSLSMPLSHIWGVEV